MSSKRIKAALTWEEHNHLAPMIGKPLLPDTPQARLLRTHVLLQGAMRVALRDYRVAQQRKVEQARACNT